jgi:fibronectin type 3 domain-containing protein
LTTSTGRPGSKATQFRRLAPRGRAAVLVRSLLPAIALTILAGTLSGPPATAAVSSSLTRYPYLTDAVQTSVTVNWATTASGSAGSVRWGPAGSCAANTTPATKTNITVGSTPEYQWTATIPVSPDTRYCYRVVLDGTDLLGSDPTPSFTSQVAASSNAPFSFAVFGDWGAVGGGSVNADQANVLRQISLSGARFAVMAGDIAYPNASQTNHGDLRQTGTNVSSIFAPSFWAVPGRSIPVFNVIGNHGFDSGSTQILNWPEGNAASSSGGRYAMESYPSVNGAAASSYPSMWYAFDAGRARFYILTTAWSDSNPGNGQYGSDAAAHWRTTSAEYQWLKNDLATHPRALKFAFWHYPLYANPKTDSSIQGGTGTLQGLLDANNVNIVFNGHLHAYERNKPDAAGMVSYVFGNAGASGEAVSGCSSWDAYAIGAGGSHCGAAPAGLSADHVFGFGKVTINGQQVTVAPTDEMGRTFDVQTYTFPNNEPDSQAPSTPANLTANAPSRGEVDLSWLPSSDDVGVTGYRVYRDGSFLKALGAGATTYSDTAVTAAHGYSYQVTAVDAAGNESQKQSPPVPATTPGPPDTQPPSAPPGLTASTPTATQVNLSWAASSDDIGVAGYKVYRDGTSLEAQPIVGTTYSDDEASPGTTYTYEVSALDTAGNESAKSSVTVKTPPAGGGTLTFSPSDDATVDASQPNTNFGTSNRIVIDNSPVNNSLLKFTVSGTGSGTGCPSISAAKLQLTVGNTSNDNSDRGGDFRAAANSNWSESSVTWNNAPAASGSPVASISTPVALGTAYQADVTPVVTGNGTYTIRVSTTSGDGARYYSRNGNAANLAPQLLVSCGTGGGGGGDTTPPSTPGTPTLNSVTSSSVSFSWAASSDNVGVTAYRVFRNGNQVGTTAGNVTSYQDTGLTPSTSYSYRVQAVDAANNPSPQSGALSATTSPSAGGGTLTFSPSDDATVDASQPNTNFGTSNRIVIDNSPVNNSLLKFTVSGTGSGTGCPSISAAKLQLTVGNTSNDNSDRGGDFRAAANSNWSESSVTWNNAPAASGSPVASISTPVALGTAYQADVTPVVTGNGTYTIRVSTTSGDGARYYSRNGNAANLAPQLLVSCGTGSLMSSPTL